MTTDTALDPRYDPAFARRRARMSRRLQHARDLDWILIAAAIALTAIGVA